jgi:hypothetical protein
MSRRPRLIDLVLIAVAGVMVVATATEVHRVYALRSRAPQDRVAFRTFLRERGDPIASFAAPQLVRGVGGMDLECATRRPVLSSGWRLCVLLRRTGPLDLRAVRSYRHDFVSRRPSAPSAARSRPRGGRA